MSEKLCFRNFKGYEINVHRFRYTKQVDNLETETFSQYFLSIIKNNEVRNLNLQLPKSDFMAELENVLQITVQFVYGRRIN